jgi:hypothetical protein
MAFDPIVIRYDGLTADDHHIDLGPVGISLQGAAQLLGSAGTIVVTGQYAKRAPALQVRVLAGVAREGSWEIPAILMPIVPAVTPMLPAILDHSKKLASNAVTAIVKYVIGRLSGSEKNDVNAQETVQKAMAEVGLTSRHAIDAVVRMATYQRAAARLLAHPVGEACSQVRIGSNGSVALLVDRSVRDGLDAPGGDVIVAPARVYEIMLSELDLKNRSCKFQMREENDPDHRVNGEITDPVVQLANNPYSAALSAQRWLSVQAKAEIREGELEKLYISDIA